MYPFKLLLVFILTVTFSGTAYGHKIRVFAYTEGHFIKGETAYSGGRPAKNVSITVMDDRSGKTLLTTSSDHDGQFQLLMPENAHFASSALTVIVNDGSGHRAQWKMTDEESLPAAPPPVHLAQQKDATLPDEARIQQIIDESLDRKLRPIIRQLKKNNLRQVTVQDIIGGLGYIIGLAGVAAYLQARNIKRKDDEM